MSSDCGVERRTVTNYFEILSDLLISYELSLFTKRAKRELIKHRKFYFFDAGLFRTLKPTGPLDSESELNGLVFETLVLQELMALNEYLGWGYQISYWHTKKHEEVDFILYGKRGFFAIEVKSSNRLRDKDFESLELFMQDYPESKGMMIYGGEKSYWNKKIEVIPANFFFKNLKNLF
ncbi:MAG: DUF4143 domain-containing protein [Bacteriovoracaceae bacterium]|nr:DUF4143 domain-containing protein [Bacteriovoracaceae bacterium]